MLGLLAPIAGFAQSYGPSALTPEQLLERASAARGKLANHAYREVDRTVNGSLTSSSEMLVEGDDFAETTTDGPISQTDGMWHGIAWERNPNGIVVRRTGYAEDPFRKALEAPSAATSGARVLGTTADATPAIVLEVKPQDALVQRRYYDAQTYLLRRVETTSYDGRTHVREYEDYRAFEGRLIPRTERYHDGRPENDSTTQVVSIETIREDTAASLAIPATTTPFTFSSGAPVEIPATFTDDGIVVRLDVNGRGLDFLLDSGASGIAIDSATAQNLGLALYGHNIMTIGGDFTFSTTRIPAVSVGALHARNLAVTVLPFTDPVGGMKVVGLLGGDFFASGIVTIDFHNQSLKIAPALPSVPEGFSKVPISVDDYVPMLHAAFNGKTGLFVADLGAGRTVLYPHYFAQFKAPDEPSDDSGLSFIGGETKTHSYRLSNLDLGDYAVGQVLVSVPSNRKVEDETFDGLLGRDILSYFTLIFDYPNATMYLKPFAAK